MVSSMIMIVYELLYVVPVCVSMAALLSPILYWTAPLPLIITAYVIFSGSFVVFRRSRWLVRLTMIGTYLGLTVVFFLALRNDSFRELYEEYNYYLWVIVFSMGCFLFGELMASFRGVRLFGAVLSAGLLIYLLVSGDPVGKTGVISLFALILASLSEEVQRTWKKEGDTERKKHLVFVYPFIMLVLMAVTLAPVSEDPYDWNFVKKAYRTVRDTIDDVSIRWSVFNSSDAMKASMGFSGRGSLFGSVSNEQTEALEVSSLRLPTERLYLSGKTFNEFNGREWVNSDNSEYADYMLDTIQIMAAVDAFTDVRTDLIRSADLKIVFLRTNTRSVFLPAKSDLSGSSLSQYKYHMVSGDVLFDKKQGYKTEYAPSYLRMNTEHPIFLEFLRGSEVPSEKEWNHILNQKYLRDNQSLSYESFLLHRDHIYETYGETVELSPKLRVLMDQVYDGAEDEYEKLLRLEKFLSGFRYTESPGEIPKEITDASGFLDYFILEKREGYCTHFATAFALLARAEGIPARMTQGYSVATEETKTITVTSAMAHAWPEVYFDNAGWLSYEPTPGYKKLIRWMTRAESDAHKAGYTGFEGIPEPEELPEIDPDFAVTNEDEHASEGRSIYIRWYYIVLPIAGALVFFLLFLLVGNLINRLRLSRMSDEELVKLYCKKNIRLLAYLGYKIGNSETLEEYRKRILSEYPEAPLRFIEIYEHALYSKLRNPNWSLDDTLEDRRKLLTQLRKTRKWQYIRYLLTIQ